MEEGKRLQLSIDLNLQVNFIKAVIAHFESGTNIIMLCQRRLGDKPLTRQIAYLSQEWMLL